jgi:opacity protein-like surface antigen
MLGSFVMVLALARANVCRSENVESLDDATDRVNLADYFQSPSDTEPIQPAGHTSCGHDIGPLCAAACDPAYECDTACGDEVPACASGCATCGTDQAVCCTCQPCSRDRWYVSVSGAWQQRETVHEVDDSQTFIKFHSGFAANGALGVRFDTFRLELETSFMNNEIDLAGAGGASSPSPGNVNLRAYMFNVYHDVEFQNCCWKPYVGAGIGIYQSEINGLIPEFFGNIGPSFSDYPINATSDMPLAYQFRAGVSRQVGCRSEFFSGYRYFKGEELEFASAPFAQFAPTFHPDGAEVHAIELGVRVNF